MTDKFIYLTKEGFENLKKELEYLKTDKRIEIAEKLKEAISYGDLSENSEYEDARNEQSQIEVRIKQIEADLKLVKLIDEDDADQSKVKMGSLVKLVEIIDGKEQEKVEYKIMGSMETDILATPPRISNESPVGKAIIGKKKGATVNVKAPAGTKKYKIISFK
ncbi:MAG: transcription elongation factor GreA [Candidatus Gracilibacteria bacterium]|nr:transcription elongation factor GreA [Candidatus Gracilibacteria bacterium]